ncbi:MAG: hypothetical protein IBJ18_06590 [Phycisphaerales bacterium]|nr:hypothetical protein [Phycisphaerales bacterium]
MSKASARRIATCIFAGGSLSYASALVSQFEPNDLRTFQPLRTQHQPKLARASSKEPLDALRQKGYTFETWDLYFDRQYSFSFLPTKSVSDPAPLWAHTPTADEFAKLGSPSLITSTARGWPMLCATYSFWHEQTASPSATASPQHRTQYLGAFAFSDRPTPTFVLPYTPIWSGLLLNTAFYAVLFAFARRIVRAVRSFEHEANSASFSRHTL